MQGDHVPGLCCLLPSPVNKTCNLSPVSCSVPFSHPCCGDPREEKAFEQRSSSFGSRFGLNCTKEVEITDYKYDVASAFPAE